MEFAIPVLALIVGITLATPAVSNDMTIGFKGGVNIANLGGEDVTDVSSLTAFSFGGVFNYSWHKNIGIQAEALYSRKGAKADDIGGELTMNLDYVEIPVLAKVMFPTTGSTQLTPHFLVGPALSIETNCSASIGGVDADCVDDVGLATKSVDFGAVLGGGIDIPAGRGMFSVDGRYVLGLSSIEDSGDGDVKNRNVSFMVGYSIPLGQ